MINVTQRDSGKPIGGKSGLNAKLWPNGEISIWKSKTVKIPKLPKKTSPNESAFNVALKCIKYQALLGLADSCLLLGLSPLPIFDKVESEHPERVSSKSEPRERKGLSGITGYGKRMVRNAAQFLQETYGRARCVFATVTIPDLPIKQMGVIHEKWHQLVEYYRLGIRRELQKKCLTGEIVTVSEVQEERYEKCNLPVLHLHSVFVGVDATGKYAISTERHDDIWIRAVQSVVDINRDDFTAACNLQRVRKSASAYLGKYMSKGAKIVGRIVDQGFGRWLPKHWWNCSRTLTAKIKGTTRVVNAYADWLNDMADFPNNNIWIWHRDVLIEMPDGQEVPMARYGKITQLVAGQIEMSISLW